MGFLDFFRPKIQLAIGDCFSRSLSRTARFPINLSGRTPDGRKNPLCRIHRLGDEFSIEGLDATQPVRIDGIDLNREQTLERDRAYGLSLSRHLIVIRLSRDKSSFADGFLDGDWDISKIDSPEDRETLSPAAVHPASLAERYPSAEDFLAFPAHVDACFLLSDLIAALPEADHLRIEATKSSPRTPRASPPAFASKGPAGDPSLRPCPYCWKPFAAGDALSIASHSSLTGDPVLGEHAKLRFPAQRFNPLGQALDAEDVPAVDSACPHCRGRLPPSFFSHDQLILSLVGAPSSGKSYYLSVLLRQLPETMIRHFGANLQDGDPSGNAQLNEMKNRLFSATSPEDAFISKTDFEGVMYERLFRNGKLVPLPRPFVYYLQRLSSPQTRASLVFYDNAGEHFKPGIALDDSPGALHVAASAGLLFLFDPSTHPAFRKRLRRKRDPQLRTHATDEQDTILAELGVRVKKMRALESHEQVDTPLAIIVGKFDLWQSLLPPEAIAIPQDRPLTSEEIEKNSSQVRQLLAELSPTIVANAESISGRVRYFPVSSLGHSPKEIETGPLAGRLSPNPKRLNPILAAEPALWILQMQASHLIDPDTPPVAP